jgi:Fe-S protein assembly chaperone HscA
MPRTIGIDLGTTNSLAAIVENDVPRILPDSGGRNMVPSVTHFSDDGSVLVGYNAYSKIVEDPKHTVFSIKRFMGKGLEEVQDDLSLLPFETSSQSEHIIRINIHGRDYTPPELSAFILQDLKRNAEAALGEEVPNAVITVPAYFNDAQRQATKDAGRIAGLNVLRIVNEPTAASLAYGLQERTQGVVAIYDFGGGTFDISILKLTEGIFEVLSTSGDTYLGGDDIDKALIRLVLDDLEEKPDNNALQSIRLAVRQSKEDLSNAKEAAIILPDLNYVRAITRDEFDRLIAPIVERTLVPCRQALKDADLDPDAVDEVVMVGGSTRIPLVRQRVKELFGRVPHTELNPDEVVALGAAVQADILTGSRRDTLLLDVTPLSLGIETMGGVVSKIIPRNSTIPASATESFTTYTEGQTNVKIHVLQGERELIGDCRSLAEFDLADIPAMPAGLPRIDVTFLIDADGILSVSAREIRTRRYQSIEVKPTYGLTDDQVESMILESFEYAEADIEARLVIEARNETETVLKACKRSVGEEEWAGLSEEERKQINGAVERLKEAAGKEDHQAIRDAIEVLNESTMKLAELIMTAAIGKAIKNKRVKEIQ